LSTKNVAKNVEFGMFGWSLVIQGEVSVTSGWRLDFLADFAIPYEISDGLVPWCDV